MTEHRIDTLRVLNEVEIANRFGPSFSADDPATLKRRVRKMAAAAGVQPALKRKQDWFFRESDLEKLLSQPSPAYSRSERRRSTHLPAGRSRSGQSRAQEFLTPVERDSR